VAEWSAGAMNWGNSQGAKGPSCSVFPLAMIPVSLRPGGVNPLGRLHSLLSEALHSQPEAESVKLAGEF
jgi:hypothetical protein